MESSVNFGKKIRQRRLALNLRMDDVAKKANITRSTLWSLEKGAGNCSIQSVLKIMEILGLSLSVEAPKQKEQTRRRATRKNSVLAKKINRFLILCVEQYALHTHQPSRLVYQKMKEKDLLRLFESAYEDLHGMSTPYLNEYIDSLLKGKTA